MPGTQKAIISWGVGKRNMESTMDFLHDLRSRVIGQPEISTDGFHPYRVAMLRYAKGKAFIAQSRGSSERFYLRILSAAAVQ